MHVTFDLSEIEEMMLQQARKQLETELETTLHSFGDVGCLYTAVLFSPVHAVHSPVHSPVQSPAFTETRNNAEAWIEPCAIIHGGSSKL